jgi:hypothetical protein
MLNYNELRNRLAELGCTCVTESSFHELEALSGSSIRVICGANNAFHRHSVVPTGLSFWIHDAAEFAFVGLWNGQLFLTDSCDLVDLCVSLCHSTAPNDAPLSTISSEILASYGLVEVELLHLSDVEAFRWVDARPNSAIPPDSLRKILETLRAKVDRIEIAESGRVEIRLGNARALTKVLDSGLCPCITFAFHGALSETDDHVQLLRLIQEVSGFAMYDGGWGNRIDIADTYYRSHSDRLRSSEPANWITKS